MYEFLLILILAALGLLSHVTRKNRSLELALRLIILSTGLWETWLLFTKLCSSDNSYIEIVFAITALTTVLLLFKPFREFISWLTTGIQLVITGQVWMPLIRRELKPIEYIQQKKIFMADSFPHLIALFIYVTAVAYLLTSIELKTLNISMIPLLDDPTAIHQLLPYSGIALVLLALSGIGFFVTRSFKEALSRLALIKPSKLNICIGIILIFFSFTYSAYWIIYTHSTCTQPDLATRLSYYDTATFTLAGTFLPSIILALVSTTLAAIGEETLIRGALQPVFGILPSALLHGLLLSQLDHTSVLILQVTSWSLLMGLVRRYTNTTTTIIGHAGFNMFTMLLYATNP